MRPVRRMLACLFAVAIPAGCALLGPDSYRLVPSSHPGYALEGKTATVRTEAFRLSVTPLDDMARGAFIQGRAAGAIDPFGPSPDGAVRYVTFRMTVENMTKEKPVVFQPQNFLLASELGDRIYPLDYPQAYTRLVGTESSDPRLVEDLSKYLFDVGVNVPAGERAEGLLVYPAPKRLTQTLRLEISFIQVGGETSSNFDIFFSKEHDS